MRARGVLLAACLATGAAHADDAPHWVGDLGVGVQRTRAEAPGASARRAMSPTASTCRAGASPATVPT